MALTETEGVVLRGYNLAEADRIIVLFTRTAGLIRGVARGSRRLKSKFAGALEPFTVLSIEFGEREGRELVSLRNVDIQESLFGLAPNPEVFSSLSGIANLLIQFSPPHEPNEKLYRMLLACIGAFRSDEPQPEAISRYFEIWLLKLSGFLPDMKRCARCGQPVSADSPVYFDSDFRLICAGCSGGKGLRVPSAALAQILSAFKIGPMEFATDFRSIPRTARDELSLITKRFVERTLQTENEGRVR
jgi:DNA repair protein RecO (recombination protein O)